MTAMKLELQQKDNDCFLRGHSLRQLAARYGTPFYLYDTTVVQAIIDHLNDAFGDRVSLYYAVKANPNADLLRWMKGKVEGLDIASYGELKLATSVGHEARHMGFAGPGKTDHEIQGSLEDGVGHLSVESFSEMEKIVRAVADGAPPAKILLRINPELLVRDFAVKMGGKASPFGIDEEDIPAALDFIEEHSDAMQFDGIHIYSGTQCFSAEALAENLDNIFRIAANIQETRGLPINVINTGGGFGVPYYGEKHSLDIADVAERFNVIFDKYEKQLGSLPHIILELGRYLVADAGLYVAEVVSEKASRGEHFKVLNGGMNHHLSASGNLGATIRKNYSVVNLTGDAEPLKCSLVGPLCTPMDLMAKSIEISEPRIGDLVGFLASGSYGYSASPLGFLGHKPPAEILISD